MTILIGIVCAVILLFGFVVLFGAPYVPTMQKQAEQAMDLLGLKEGNTLIDLGSGDGALLIASAKRRIHVVGYEINPILVIISWFRTMHYRKFVKIKWRNYWGAELPEAQGVYVFLLDKYMNKLDKKLIQYARGRELKVVSYGFEIPSRKPAKTEKALRLYVYN